jgi:hypothetical protein
LALQDASSAAAELAAAVRAAAAGRCLPLDATYAAEQCAVQQEQMLLVLLVLILGVGEAGTVRD